MHYLGATPVKECTYAFGVSNPKLFVYTFLNSRGRRSQRLYRRRSRYYKRRLSHRSRLNPYSRVTLLRVYPRFPKREPLPITIRRTPIP